MINTWLRDIAGGEYKAPASVVTSRELSEQASSNVTDRCPPTCCTVTHKNQSHYYVEYSSNRFKCIYRVVQKNRTKLMTP